MAVKSPILTLWVLLFWIWLEGNGLLAFDHQNDHYSTLVIMEHPSNATVVEFDPVTLNCKAGIVHNIGANDIGIKSRDPVMIEWFHEGSPVLGPHGDDHRIVLPDGSLFFLRALRGIDDGNYWCVASNLNSLDGQGPVSTNRVARSRNATLRVAYLSKDFKAEPSDLEGDEGFTLILPCGAPSGYPAPMVTWKRDNEYVNLDQRIHIDGNTGNLKIKSLFKEDEGTYQCIVSNIAGSRESTTAKLHVRRPPFFTKEPENATVKAGEDVFLPCSANGDPPPKTRWRRLGPGLPPEGVTLDLPNFKVVPGEGLYLNHVLPNQDGLYECQAISVVGSSSIMVKLSVLEAPVITRRPVKEVVVPLDGATVLECNATGNPKPVLLWMRERDRTVLLPGDRTDTGLEVKADGALALTNIRATSTYVCLVANVVGSGVARSTVSLGTRMGDILVEGGANPPQVEIQQVQGSSSTSIKVSWRLLLASAEASVDGFYIMYRSCVGEPPGFTSITVLHAAATSYVINRLEPFTPYEFMVIPFSRGLSGQPSALHKAKTLEARPLLAPTDLKWHQVNTSTVDVTWKPVPLEGFRGLPLGYQILILQAGGRMALNRSLPFEDNSPHLLMSNLEPKHSYYIQVAAFNSRGTGPFSDTLEVRPEPSLAHLGSPAGISDSENSIGGVAWITPLVIGFVVAIALIATAALVYVRKASTPKITLTPILFNSGGRGRHEARKSTTTPTFREFQLVSSHAHTHHAPARKSRTVSIWGLSSTLNRIWKGGGRGSSNKSGRGNRRRQSVHVSHGLTSEESESDYAYIDRSTHSITGYLNNGRGHRNSHALHSTLSTCADSLSPYATTHVLHHHHHHHHQLKRQKRHQPLYASFHTLPRRQPYSGSLQPLSVTTFLVPSTSHDPALSDPGGVATLGRRRRRLTENSDHIYARVLPKDRRMASMSTSAASLASTPPNLLDLIPPPPTYPPPSPLLSRRKAIMPQVASEAVEETSRLLMTEECDGSLLRRSSENGYAKLKRNKSKVLLGPGSDENEVKKSEKTTICGGQSLSHHQFPRLLQHQAGIRTNEISNHHQRKLNHHQDLTTPDIVTWLPVLLSTNKATTATASHQKLTNGLSEASQVCQEVVVVENGQKTLVEDGLVFRSPEMKRSLRRKKKNNNNNNNNRSLDLAASSSSENEAEEKCSFHSLRKQKKRKNSSNATKK